MEIKAGVFGGMVFNSKSRYADGSYAPFKSWTLFHQKVPEPETLASEQNAAVNIEYAKNGIK
jgi:hypothetical protein